MVLGAASLLVLTTGPVAQAVGRSSHVNLYTDKHGHMHHPADLNSDQQVSRDEAVSFARKRFAELDSDGNGYLDREDLNEWGQQKNYRGLQQLGGQLFLRMDLNSDGTVSVEEAVATELERHQDIDQNHDGLLSVKEHRAHKRVRHIRRASGFFDRADINHDNQLSRQELQGALQQMRERRNYWGIGTAWAHDQEGADGPPEH